MPKTRLNQILTIIFLAVAGCLIYAVSSGIRANYGIMLNAISASSGISYSSVSFVLAVGQLMFGVIQPFFGIVALKKSNSFVLGLGALMIAAGLLMVPLCRTFWQLLIFLGILLPAGTGALSFGIVMGAITPMLGQRKAAAVSGFVSASSGLGNIVLSPVIQSLIASSGLWGVMIFLSIPALIVIPLALWLSKSAGAGVIGTGRPAEKSPSMLGMFSETIRNKSYIFLLVGFFTCGFHMAIIETHLYTQITSYGFSEQIAAYAFSVYGILAILGSIVSGVLGSRFKMKWVLGSFYASRFVIIVLFFILSKTIFSIYAFLMLLGFTGNATVPPTSGLINHLFGPAKLAVLLGFAFLSHQTGSFFSAWLGGISIAATGGYELIWYFSALLSVLAAIVSFSIQEDSSQEKLKAQVPALTQAAV